MCVWREWEGVLDWDGTLSGKSPIEVVFLLAQPSLPGEGDIGIR